MLILAWRTLKSCAISKEFFLSFFEAVYFFAVLQEQLMDIVEVSDVAVVSRAAGFELLSPELFNEFCNFAAAQSSVLVERNQELVGVSRGLSSGAKWGIAGWEAGAAVFAGASYHAYQAFNKFHTIFDQLTSTIILILSYIVFSSVVLIQKESIHLLNHGCAEFLYSL